MNPKGRLGRAPSLVWEWVQEIAGKPRFLGYSVTLHVLLGIFLVFSLEWTHRPSAPPEVNVVQATVVDESKVAAEMQKLKDEEAARQSAESARQKKLREDAAAAERRRKQEEQRLADLQKQKAETQRKVEEERQRLKAEQDKAAAEAAKARELEARKKAEAERLAALKKEQEELERKRKAEEARKQAERQLQEQLAAEQKAIEAERARQVQGEVDRYIEIIKQKVQRNWIEPPSMREGLSCKVQVRLMPGGGVLSAHVSASSGDPIFDASVEKAVLKASPLPLPADPTLFDRFRDLEFLFNPKGSQ